MALATINGSTIISAFALIAAGRTGYDATAKSIQTNPQTALFAYWSVDDGFNSSVILNNAGNFQLILRPTLYNLDGQSLEVNPIVLEARQLLIANIADWIKESGGGELFKQGNLIIAYDAPDPASLGAQVSITNSVSGLSFDVPPENPLPWTLHDWKGCGGGATMPRSIIWW